MTKNNPDIFLIASKHTSTTQQNKQYGQINVINMPN